MICEYVLYVCSMLGLQLILLCECVLYKDIYKPWRPQVMASIFLRLALHDPAILFFLLQSCQLLLQECLFARLVERTGWWTAGRSAPSLLCHPACQLYLTNQETLPGPLRIHKPLNGKLVNNISVTLTEIYLALVSWTTRGREICRTHCQVPDLRCPPVSTPIRGWKGAQLAMMNPLCNHTTKETYCSDE